MIYTYLLMNNEYSIDNCVIKGLFFTDASFVTNENF